MFQAGKGAATHRTAARVLAAALCVAAFAAPVVSSRAWADDPKPAAPEDDKLKTLLRTRLEVAQALYDLRMLQFKAGRVASDQLVAAGKQLFKSQLDLAEKKEERVSACEKNLERWTTIKQMADAQFNAGKLDPADHKQVEYERVEAEIILEQEKAK
jgi:hypothetical protein